MKGSKLIRVSDRGTVSLGKLADYEYYMAIRREDGSILMKPVSVQLVERKNDLD